MIRDPSDGSVKKEEPSKLRVPPIAGHGSVIPSGLPAFSDDAERLQKSREWLKEYHDRRAKA